MFSRRPLTITAWFCFPYALCLIPLHHCTSSGKRPVEVQIRELQQAHTSEQNGGALEQILGLMLHHCVLFSIAVPFLLQT